MKKYIAILLAALIFCFAGCSGETNDNADTYLGMARDFIEKGDIDAAIDVLEKGIGETDNAEIKAMLEGLTAAHQVETTIAVETTTVPETTVPETTEVVTTEITTPEITTTEATTTEPPLPDFSVYEGIWYATGYKIIFSNGDTGNCEFSCTGQFFELEEEFNVSELVNDTYSCIYYDPMMGIDILLEFKFEYPSIVMTSVEKYPDGSKSSPQIEVFEHK